MAPDASHEENYYDVLEVQFEASFEDIRQSYRNLARQLHPDRARAASTSKKTEAMDHFHKVQRAFECLSSRTRRLMYDLRVFGRSSLPGGDEAGLLEEQRKQALIDLDNMQDKLQSVLRQQKVGNGAFIVKKALYGNLRLREDRLSECMSGKQTIQESDLQGPFIEVTMPVQCMVEKFGTRKQLIIPGGGRSSKADLAGFYNPVPFDTELELELYVLFEYCGTLHEATVADREMLRCPRKAQQVQVVPRGPFSSSNVSLQLALNAVAERGTMRNRSNILDRAVTSYRLASLKAGSKENPTCREFSTVVVCSSALIALLGVWARWGKRS